MIPAFLAGRNHGSFLNDTQIESRHGPIIVPRSEHNVSRANISPNALKVLYRLKSAGFEAFLVGGGVRDLLLDRHPVHGQPLASQPTRFTTYSATAG
jgi:hypothetical protein